VTQGVLIGEFQSLFRLFRKQNERKYWELRQTEILKHLPSIRQILAHEK